MKKAKSESPDWQTLPKDIWMSLAATATLSPLDVSRLRATCVFFRSTIADTAKKIRGISVDIALSWAAEGGHRDIVELMIEKGATNFDWPLCYAARGGHRDIVELMIEQGASYLNGALYSAAYANHRDIVMLMIEKGATNLNGALHWAAEGCHQEIVELLKQKCAK